MSEWEYSIDKVIFYDEYYFVPRYPRHVARAFIVVWFEEPYDILGEAPPYQYWIEKAIEDFGKRWGGLDDAVFLRVLQEGRGSDRLAAIFAIGYNPALIEATDLLFPFLTSSDLLERCAAACMLALRRDERALPILEEYLCVEPEDEQGNYLIEATVWYASYQIRIAGLLARWGPPSVISVLRQSFVHLWKREEKYGGGGNTYNHSTEDALCYALGRRGALEEFHEIELPAQRRRLALMYMALGYVQADERFENLKHEVFLNRSLQQELAVVLAEHFSLSQEEIAEAIDSFGDDIHEREHATYGIDDMEDEDEEPKEEK